MILLIVLIILIFLRSRIKIAVALIKETSRYVTLPAMSGASSDIRHVLIKKAANIFRSKLVVVIMFTICFV